MMGDLGVEPRTSGSGAQCSTNCANRPSVKTGQGGRTHHRRHVAGAATAFRHSLLGAGASHPDISVREMVEAMGLKPTTSCLPGMRSKSTELHPRCGYTMNQE